MGFVSSDSSLFIYKNHGITIFILIYVDNIIITGTSPQHINLLINKLADKFCLKNMGKLQFFLGTELITLGKSGSIELSQRRYIYDLLTRTNMDLSTPELTPMVSTSKLSIKD